MASSQVGSGGSPVVLSSVDSPSLVLSSLLASLVLSLDELSSELEPDSLEPLVPSSSSGTKGLSGSTLGHPPAISTTLVQHSDRPKLRRMRSR